jgi:hypothetical protein
MQNLYAEANRCGADFQSPFNGKCGTDTTEADSKGAALHLCDFLRCCRKIRTNPTIFTNANFLLPLPSTTCNFNALKCTDFDVAVGVPPAVERGILPHGRSLRSVIGGVRPFSRPLAFICGCFPSAYKIVENRRFRRFSNPLDHAVPSTYDKSKSASADFAHPQLRTRIGQNRNRNRNFPEFRFSALDYRSRSTCVRPLTTPAALG